MAPKGLKRPAAADGRIVKRSCKEVAKALADAELPAPVVKTLKLAAPFALSTYADERHPNQTSIIGMIEDALKGIQASLQKDVDEAQALVSDKGGEKVAREKALSKAGKELMDSKVAAAGAEYEVYEATQTHKKAVDALKEVVKTQKTGDKAYVKLAKEKETFESLKAKILGMKETKCSSKEALSVEAELKSFGVDESLADSLHLVLVKDPSERSEFDGTIMAKLDDELGAATVKFDGKLSAEEPGRKAREDATTAARSTSDSAKEKLTTLEGTLKAAEGTVTKCEKALSAAEDALKSYPSDMASADSDLANVKETLQSFLGTMQKFMELKDRKTPPPPQPEPEVPAEA